MLTVLVVSCAEIKNGPLWWCNHFWQSLEEGAGKWCSKCALTTHAPAYWPKFATVKSQAAGYFFSPFFFSLFFSSCLSCQMCVFLMFGTWIACTFLCLPLSLSVSVSLCLCLSVCLSVCLSLPPSLSLAGYRKDLVFSTTL